MTRRVLATLLTLTAIASGEAAQPRQPRAIATQPE